MQKTLTKAALYRQADIAPQDKGDQTQLKASDDGQ
jgi:hypothetical protein